MSQWLNVLIFMLNFAVKSSSAVVNPKSETRNLKQYQNSNVQNSKHQKYDLPWQKLFVLEHWDFGHWNLFRPALARRGGYTLRSL